MCVLYGCVHTYGVCVHVCIGIPYSRKLSREKIFTNFAYLEPPAKVFSTKFGACHSLPTYDTGFSIPQKFSP